MQKVPAVMKAAAMKINRAERFKACLFMERFYRAKLKQLTSWDDFPNNQNKEMAAEAAAAEALFRFA